MSFQTYNTNIPNPPNSPSSDVPLMQVNTNSIANLIAQDHYGFNDNLGGTHKHVILTNEAAPGLGVGNGVLYANLATQSWPFWQNALGSFQIMGAVTAAASGSVTLPGGIILKWGSKAIAAGSSVTGSVTFAGSGGNFPTAAFAAVLGINSKVGGTGSSDNTLAIRSGSLTTTGFTYDFNGNSGSYTSFYWLAVGN